MADAAESIREIRNCRLGERRGLDPERGRKVLEYVARVWRRPVTLTTVDNDNRSVELAVSTAVDMD